MAYTALAWRRAVKIGHAGDILHIQSVGLVMKKLNLTQQELRVWQKRKRSKQKSKENLSQLECG